MKSAQEMKNSRQAALLFPALVIAVISFAAYSNSIANGFIYDDYSQVVRNPIIRELRNIPKLFARSAWTFEGAPPVSNYYRPVANAFYTLCYVIFGPHPWGFHLVNILFHAGSSVIVFLLAEVLFDTTGPTSAKSTLLPSAFPAGTRRKVGILSPSFIAGLLFAVHPVHTEAVNWIAGLSDVAFSFFFLLSLYLYALSQGMRRPAYIVSVLSFFLAVLCKEPALTLPVILISYDYCFGSQAPWSADRLKRYVPYLIVALIYFALRFSALGGLAPMRKIGGLSDYEYLINILPLLRQYLGMLLLPLSLNFWHAFNPITSLLSREGLLSLSVTVAFIVCLAVSLKKNRAAFFALVFVAVPLAPAFYIKGIIGKPFAERYLYLPSVGFALLLSLLFARVEALPLTVTKRFAAAFLLLAGIYATGTVARNAVWQDEYTLFADTARKSPDSVIPRLEFGNALLAKNRFDEAIEQYQAAMRMEPQLYVIYHHLGLALAGENRLYEAIEQYRIALTLYPESPEIHADLGHAYAKAGFLRDAVQEFLATAELQPTAENHNLLGIAYAQSGQIDKAVEEFTAAKYLNPENADYCRNLAEALELREARRSGSGRKQDFTGTYEGHAMKNQDIFNFAW